TDLMGIGNDRENGLVKTASEDLQLPPLHESAQSSEIAGAFGLQPVQQNARKVHAHADAGMRTQNVQERAVSLFERPLENEIEISHRLVVVDRPVQVDHLIAFRKDSR